MDRLQASLIAGLAAFLLAISLAPAGSPQQLLRDSNQKLVLAPSLPVANPSRAITTQRAIESNGLLQWRLAYTKHYEASDRKRATPTSPIDHITEVAEHSQPNLSPEEQYFAPASLRSEGARAAQAVPEKLAARQRLAAEMADYWTKIRTETEARLEKSEPVENRAAPSVAGYTVVAMMPGPPSRSSVLIAMFIGLCMFTFRFINERCKQVIPGTARNLDQLADDSIERLRVHPASTADPQGPICVILPECWLIDRTLSRIAERIDSIALFVMFAVLTALLWRISHQPAGMRRLLWWPLSELSAIW